RAPGYTLNAALYGALEAQGYRYDSSTFPAPPYYLAKAGVMGALSMLGRPSRAILDSPAVLFAPRDPYWPDPANPYSKGAGKVFELPIATAPATRVPFIGGLAVGFPSGVVRPLYATLRRTGFFNFELHAVDLLGMDDGIPKALVRAQRDLAIP